MYVASEAVLQNSFFGIGSHNANEASGSINLLHCICPRCPDPIYLETTCISSTGNQEYCIESKSILRFTYMLYTYHEQ